ncbi:MAG: hypothetical protein H6733_01120 [Alphaproteobacteria bacterium]|nr:hypothetical protein [Alphaproteobacteria bacterium]
MTVTGHHVRTRLRRRLVRGIDWVVAWLDDTPPSDAAPDAAAPPPTPDPHSVPTDDAAAAPSPTRNRPAKPTTPTPPPLPPLPALDKPAPPPRQRAARPTETPSAPNRPVAGAATPPDTAGTTSAGAAAKASPEERQAQHQARTRKGLLRFVHDQGGRATLRELHAYSERTYFVAHVAFSRMMEELTGEGLLDYDHDTATATLTVAGQAELA